MTASIPAGPPPRLSVPPKFVAPRQLTDAELGTLRAIAQEAAPNQGRELFHGCDHVRLPFFPERNGREPARPVIGTG